jgi:hypothetical protein
MDPDLLKSAARSVLEAAQTIRAQGQLILCLREELRLRLAEEAQDPGEGEEQALEAEIARTEHENRELKRRLARIAREFAQHHRDMHILFRGP